MITILITGASSGIGAATARQFQANSWNVVATMRDPSGSVELGKLDNVHLTRLDVTDAGSIASSVAESIDRFGKIDVLLNNAGYGAYGPLEAFPMDRIRRQFDTNVIGLLEVTKTVLPHMRANRTGTIVNISSIGGGRSRSRSASVFVLSNRAWSIQTSEAVRLILLSTTALRTIRRRPKPWVAGLVN
ncbi:SDR family NAD(P)-dependent oxidoreductase [Ruegeria sp. AU67]|uniref:SDR family NAD(P)-dependent oxidoreductase n=1 Tax=Ruegeria sp. AU67 TaxID=2108530 RepID=UPI001F1574E4|nr:SDR family NAD(P)-dependent oxidoreductase [Ruegeria sp. AU67]